MIQKPIFRSRAWPWIALAVLWSVATLLASVAVDAPVADSQEGSSVASRILGRCVNALATAAYDRTDLTFHKGRPTYHERAFSNTAFQVLQREIAPVGHAHMGGEETKEIMSWLRIATLLDPHNVTYHLDAAYWLMSQDVNRPDEARRILLEARAANPESYLVYLGLAQFATKIGDRLLARRNCDRAITLWPKGQSADDEQQTMMDKRELLMLRVLLREMDGDMAGAAADLKEILVMFPQSPLVRARIPVIESGGEPPALAEQRWNALRKQEYQHVCEAATGEDAGHNHEHEDHK